jgi:hypothetical protein
MLLRTLRFFGLMFTALSMGTALCHFLEMPGKMTLDGNQWLLFLQRTYHPLITFGVYFEVAAVFTVVILTIYLRRRMPAFAWTLIAALCLIAADASYWIWIEPIGKSLSTLAAKALPPEWEEMRLQWEMTYAARAGVDILALACLVISVLVDTPRNPVARRSFSRDRG